MKDAPEPQNLTELESFLELLNYNGRLLPNLSTALTSLYRLLQAGVPWRSMATEQKAFPSPKQLLLSSRILAHFDPTQDLILACEASPYGIGAAFLIVMLMDWSD